LLLNIGLAIIEVVYSFSLELNELTLIMLLFSLILLSWSTNVLF
jgi:hypothetical protein